MAIPGQANINIGNVNSPVGSDTLYTAFHTIQNNFSTLFSTASPISTISGANGVSVTPISNSSYRIENTGVTELIAGQNVSITNLGGSPANTGVLVINATGGNGNGGGVTSVGLQSVSSSRLVVTNSPIISSGNIGIDLAAVSNVSGTYNNPSLTVDGYGRVTSASNGVFNGVTSVAVAAGDGISVAGGPITSTGTITVTNTGVTGIVAGTGIDVNASNGVVTITNTGSGNGGGGGTVTRVGVVPGSNNIVVSGSPVVSSGNIIVNLASNVFVNSVTSNSFIGNGGRLSAITGANVTGAVSFATTANAVAGANVSGTVANATHANVSNSANSVAGANVSGTVSSATVAASANSVAGANVSGTVAFATTANSVAGANVTGAVNLATFATTANAVAGANVSGFVANANIAKTVTTNAQPNITSVGTLTSLSVTNSVNAGTTITANNLVATTGVSAATVTANSFVTGKLITTATVPSTASSNGVAGQIAYDSGYVYICVATNTWKRAALATW